MEILRIPTLQILIAMKKHIMYFKTVLNTKVGTQELRRKEAASEEQASFHGFKIRLKIVLRNMWISNIMQKAFMPIKWRN